MSKICSVAHQGKKIKTWFVSPLKPPYQCCGSDWSDQHCCLPGFCTTLCHSLLRLYLEPPRTKSQNCEERDKSLQLLQRFSSFGLWRVDCIWRETYPTGWSSMTLTADGELNTGELSFSSVTNSRAVTEPHRLLVGSTAWSVARTTR